MSRSQRPTTRAAARVATKLGGTRQAGRIATARTSQIASKQQSRTRVGGGTKKAGVRDVKGTKARRASSG